MIQISVLNSNREWIRTSFLVVVLALDAIGLRAGGQSRDAGCVTVQLAAMAPHLEAYGQVQPISVLPVNAAQAGVISGLKVLPGMQVRAGQTLAHLEGPEIAALLLQGEADVRSAQAQLSASQKALSIQRGQLAAHLSTRQAVHQAESASAQAQTGFENARSRLQAVRRMRTLSAPANATVLALNAADGELVSAGQPIVTLQTATGLWLKASYYGADLSAVHIGMTGSFSPSNDGPAIPVKVRAIFGSLTPDGGEAIALAPASSKSRWMNGEFGTVTLNSPQRRLVAVPTQALILDQGKWWVMVHMAQGDHPQAVVPGPARGWQTFLTEGLHPGEQVVVENAYMLFHQDIAQSYQNPD